jgi:hypothetical protein
MATAGGRRDPFWREAEYYLEDAEAVGQEGGGFSFTDLTHILKRKWMNWSRGTKMLLVLPPILPQQMRLLMKRCPMSRFHH